MVYKYYRLLYVGYIKWSKFVCVYIERILRNVKGKVVVKLIYGVILFLFLNNDI